MQKAILSMNLKIIFSLIFLAASGVVAVIDYFDSNVVLTVLSIIFIVLSVNLFVLGFKQNKWNK